MRRLTPDPSEVDPVELIAGLDLRARAGADRPYTIVNFVATVDGRTSVAGGSTGLGDAGDKDIFRALRACADAVLAGTGTLAVERYGRLVRDTRFRELRARLGLDSQPLAVTVTRRGTRPEAPLLDDPDSSLIIYAGAELDLSGAAARTEVVRRDPDALTLGSVLRDLRKRGVRLLLCEGGPTVFGELVAEQLADELFLTLAPKLAGGDAGAITAGLAAGALRPLELVWALEQDGSLFLRYRLGS